VFILSRCIIYRLYTAQTFVSCCHFVYWKRTEKRFCGVLEDLQSSKNIFHITVLLFMKLWVQIDSFLLEICFWITKILRIQKWVVILIAGVNPRTPCRQLFKELKILTIVSLYILEVISYLRRHHQFVELNSNVHAYNTRRKRDIHI